MELAFRTFDLRLTHRWNIASRTGPGGGEGTHSHPVVLACLRAADGTEGLGETAPSDRYFESVQTVHAALALIEPARLSFDDLPSSLDYVGLALAASPAARCALDMALFDGASRRMARPLHDFLGLPFTEGRHVTSFSIGLDRPEIIRAKVLAAADRPILKLKVGGPTDNQNLAALRSVAPTKRVRVDANEAWKSPEEALRRIEDLARDGHIEFVEQPMPSSRPRAEWEWLKARSPLPLMADESYRSASDLSAIRGCFDAVNVKLVKAGGPGPALAALQAARNAGLKTMLGCMIETSVLISAAAHLADLADYLDLDGNLLVSNDPYVGVSAAGSLLSLAGLPRKDGLGVGRTAASPV